MEYTSINPTNPQTAAEPSSSLTARRFTIPHLAVAIIATALISCLVVSSQNPAVAEFMKKAATNACAYGDGLCVGPIKSKPETEYKVIRQCTGGLSATICDCAAILGPKKNGTVEVTGENLNGKRCECTFVKHGEGVGRGKWTMEMDCE